ncbi:SUMF1/EgtB/PvdO family nonheme iron enzyme [Coraliomargarita parva]|uniref:SUMF1/EgtB/PvdO family nonheme iron enzyme n=1 Tax=Coraliomargarita parva TaxID=3014050 RepID=UPI0022B4B9C9|nr:SUMF1/EgtB/PvdO family nonheme iron enzyme [Coraliomargarita parva]
MKKRILITLLVLLAAVVVIGGLGFLSMLGPRDVDYDRMGAPEIISPEVSRLENESIELEARFEEILVLRDATAEDLELLRRSLDLQREYVSLLPGSNREAVLRRDSLDKRYQNLMSVDVRAESEVLEREAEKLAAANSYDAARQKFREAYLKQKEINENFPLSSAYDISRATLLQRQARYLTAEPLLQRSMALEEEADLSIEAKNWAKAEEILQQAIQLQDQLNREYRGTNQASVSRLEGLKVKLVGIRSGQSHLEVERVSELADQRRMEGENLEAANLYEEAARLQRQLNEVYPESPYASSERVAEFQRKSQTAESYDLGLDIERNHDLLKQLLSERRTYEAAEVIVKLRQDIKQMQEVFPRSSLNDEDLQVKVRYLNLLQNDLGYIQDRVYDALLPIPNVEGWNMLRSEVPQALYALIMGNNPSRNRGDLNPVDSVSWTEAKSFCQRLSWVMGKPVRLPTENEFREALGRLRYVVLEDHVWSVSNAEGSVHEVATKQPFSSGFYDLLGNVSEWLESMDRFENEDARHIGGHVQDRLEVIFTVPIREAPRAERNRMTGFRIVVAVNEG